MSQKVLLLGFSLILAHLFVSRQGSTLWKALVGINTAQPKSGTTGNPLQLGPGGPASVTPGPVGVGQQLGNQVGAALGIPPLINLQQNPAFAQPQPSPSTQPSYATQVQINRIQNRLTKPSWWPSWLPFFG